MSKTVLIMGRKIADEANTLFLRSDIKPVTSDPEFIDLTTDELIRQVDPDAIVLRKGKLDEKALNLAPNLKVICKHGVGVDTIDIATASALNIPVMVTAGANATSVAEHTLTLLLCTLKNVANLDHRTRRGHWDKARHCGLELTGKHVGLIGYGRIAQAFARLLAPFNVSISAYVRDRNRVNKEPSNVHFTDDLSRLISSCDVISLHCPLNDSTRSMIGRNELSSMRRGVTIINTARGALIDETALIEALDEGQVFGVGLDCLQEEPPTHLGGLLRHPSVVVTPHIAWATSEAARNMGLMAARNIISALAGKPLSVANTVNIDTISSPASPTAEPSEAPQFD